MQAKGFGGIDTTEIEQAILGMLEIEPLMEKEIKKTLDHNAKELITNAKRRAPIHDGDIRKSLKWSKLDTEDTFQRTVYADSAIAPHAGFTEFGTGGKVFVPQEFGPIANKMRNKGSNKSYAEGLKALKKWASKKGIDESDVGGIFASILANGVSPQPFLYPSLWTQRQILLRDLDKMMKKVLSKNLKK